MKAILTFSIAFAMLCPAVTFGDTANIAQAKKQQITPQIIRRVERETLRLCSEVENPASTRKLEPVVGDKGELQMPTATVLSLLKFRYGIEPVGRVSTVVIMQPRNGRIQPGAWEAADPSYPQAQFQVFRYTPNPGFYGKDKIKYEVTVNGKTFRVSYTLNVLETWNNGDSCPLPPGVTDRG